MSELRQEFEKWASEHLPPIARRVIDLTFLLQAWDAAYALGQRDGAEKMREAAIRQRCVTCRGGDVPAERDSLWTRRGRPLWHRIIINVTRGKYWVACDADKERSLRVEDVVAALNPSDVVKE